MLQKCNNNDMIISVWGIFERRTLGFNWTEDDNEACRDEIYCRDRRDTD